MTVELAGTAGTPAPPASLGPVGAGAWLTYFESPVAAALDTVDLMPIERLCKLYDAMANIDPGDGRGEALHYAALAKLAAPLETALGITPAARARLGIKLQELKRGAAPLNLDG